MSVEDRAEDAGGDLSGAPVPDLERIARCTCSVRGDGSQVGLWGPPAGILSIARWLRSPSDDVATTAGDRRADWDAGPRELRIVVAPEGGTGAGLVGLSVQDGRCTITGSGEALANLGDVFESVGVYALDLRWAPVERRQLVVADGTAHDVAAAVEPSGHPDDGGLPLLMSSGSPALLVASAYPIDP